jgi:predicted nucleotidyltransferase
MPSVRTLARNIGVPERTLRRAVNEGLVRGSRQSARRFDATLREERYLRSHWELLSSLRAAFRTEPNVRLAVLYGSMANGSNTPTSDVDVMVELADDSVARLADLSGRISLKVGRDVQLVRRRDAEASPLVMAAITTGGRVLIDRDQRWRELRDQASTWRRRAVKASPPLESAFQDLSGS